MDSTRAKQKLNALKSRLDKLTNAQLEVTPTWVLYYHCDRLGRKLLDSLPESERDAVAAKAHDKIERALKMDVSAIAKGWSGKSMSRDEAIKSAIKYLGYLYIDALWKAVASGLWGASSPPWVARKEAGARGVPPASGALAQSYGAHGRGSKAWHGVQKGKTKGSGEVHTPEVEDIFEVTGL